MRLTEHQLRYFQTFGFLRLPGPFADEADAIIDACEQVWASHGGGHHGPEHDPKTEVGPGPIYRPERVSERASRRLPYRGDRELSTGR